LIYFLNKQWFLQPRLSRGFTVKPKMTAPDAARFHGVTLQAIHKQLRAKSLPFAKAQNRAYFGHETSRALFGIAYTPRIIALQIVKGGTGKTSLVHAIAVRASLYGARVLCIDMDQQGNLTQAFCVDADQTPCMVDILNEDMAVEDAIINVLPGLDLLPSRIENAVIDNTIMLKRLPLHRVYKDRLDPLRAKYDLILVDCPPAIGQSVAAVAMAVDCVVAPVTPEKFCLSGLKITTEELRHIEKNYKREIPVRIALNKFDNRTTLSHEVLGALIKHPVFGGRMFRSYVRVSQEFPNAIAKGQTVFDTVRETPAKDDVDLLTREVLEIGEFSQHGSVAQFPNPPPHLLATGTEG
jgi:chromosome partitioning protein